MKLVPLLLLFCTICSAKKIKKIKRLLVAIGGIASLASKGGGSGSGVIGKSLKLLTQQSSSTGTQYASFAQPLIISPAVSPLILPATQLSLNTLQPHILPTNAVVNQRTVINREIATPISAQYRVSEHVAAPIGGHYAVPIPIAKAIPVDGSVLVESSGLLDQTPILHQTTVGLGLAQSPIIDFTLDTSGWVG